MRTFQILRVMPVSVLFKSLVTSRLGDCFVLTASLKAGQLSDHEYIQRSFTPLIVRKSFKLLETPHVLGIYSRAEKRRKIPDNIYTEDTTEVLCHRSTQYWIERQACVK